MNTEREELIGLVKQLYTDLVKEVVAHPNKLQVGVKVDDVAVMMLITPHPDDVGRLTGTRNITKDSLMVIFTAIAARYGKRLEYVMDDERAFDYNFLPDFKSRVDWPRIRIMDLIGRTCAALFEHRFEIQVSTLPGKSKLYIDIRPDEVRHVTETELCSALSRVFNAIGKANGRIIYIEEIRRKGTNGTKGTEHATESSGDTGRTYPFSR